jgi:purine-cytosine permease-like protein
MSIPILLQQTTKPDLTWNYIILAVLIVIAVIFGYVTIRKRSKEEE